MNEFFNFPAWAVAKLSNEPQKPDKMAELVKQAQEEFYAEPIKAEPVKRKPGRPAKAKQEQ